MPIFLIARLEYLHPPRVRPFPRPTLPVGAFSTGVSTVTIRQWFHRAATEGNARGQHHLGERRHLVCYNKRERKKEEQSISKEHRWYHVELDIYEVLRLLQLHGRTKAWRLSGRH